MTGAPFPCLVRREPQDLAPLPDRLVTLYPTTMLCRQIEGMAEVNRQLAALIAQLQASEPNSAGGTTTEGGYQTRDDLFQRDHPALNILKQHIQPKNAPTDGGLPTTAQADQSAAQSR